MVVCSPFVNQGEVVCAHDELNIGWFALKHPGKSILVRLQRSLEDLGIKRLSVIRACKSLKSTFKVAIGQWPSLKLVSYHLGL